MNTQHVQLELMRKCLDGEATHAEFAQFEALLRQDLEFRKSYLRYVNVDLGLSTLPKREEQVDPSNRVIVRFPQWRKLASAAVAGLVFGLICASVAWAIVVPNKDSSRNVVPILTESFERSSSPIIQGFPTRAGEWGGDQAQVISAPFRHSPLDGDSILSLESSSDSNLGFIQQIIDLTSYPKASEGEMRVVEVIASFLADQQGERERYTLRVASFKESPEKIRNLWEAVTWKEMDQISLTFSKTGLSTQVDTKGWQTLSALVEAPSDASSVVISLAAGRLLRTAPKTPHYVDDVRAELRIIPFTKRLCRKKK